MTERDELQELWKSQPLKEWKGGRMPRFALLDDEISPVASPPLSISNKLAYGFWSAYVLHWMFRGRPENSTLLESAATAAFAVSIVGTAVFMLLHRNRTREPRADESVADYRSACLIEFERQYRIERRAVIFALVGTATAAVLAAIAILVANAVSPIAVIWPVMFIIFAIVLFRSRRGYWTRSINRLRHDVEDVQ